MSIKGLNEELSAAPALHIQVLTTEELSAVVGGGPFSANDPAGACTDGTRSICHNDGTTDSD